MLLSNHLSPLMMFQEINRSLLYVNDVIYIFYADICTHLLLCWKWEINKFPGVFVFLHLFIVQSCIYTVLISVCVTAQLTSKQKGRATLMFNI